MALAEPTSRAAVGSLGAIRDRGEEALTSWSCRRRRRSEARPEGRRRRDQYISERAGSPYPPGACPRAHRAAGARRRGAATAGREGGTRRTLACARDPTEWPKAAKRPACPGGTSPLAAGSCRLRPGGPSTHSGPSGLRLLRMTGGGWSAIFRRRRRRHRVGGWDTASTRGTASPSSRGPRGGVPRGGAAAAGGAASRAAAEGARAVPRRAVAKPRPGRRKAADASVAFAEPTSRAAVGALGAIRDRAEEALTSWSCRRRRRSEARPEGRRRRDQYISERAGSPYPPGACPRAHRAAGARRRGAATAGREGGTRRTLACARDPTEWP